MGTTSTFTDTTTSTTTNFECEAGQARWRTAWSVEKKAWCCEHAGEGCEYDCHAGYDVWEKGWSTDKKAWCCMAESRGCTTTTIAPPTDEPTTDPRQLILEKIEQLMELQLSTST